MTWTLVQQSSSLVATATSPATITLPSGSTAGNLLIIEISIAGSNVVPTPPAGWVERAGPGGTILNARSYIFDYINNPGGISSVSVTFTGTLRGAAFEFTCPNVSLLNSSDQTGTSGASSVSATQTTTTTGNLTANNELAVCQTEVHYTSATSSTLTEGTGFTQAFQFNNGSSTVDHGTFGYDLDTGASTGTTVSDAVGISATGAGATSGALVTYAQPVALVGAPPFALPSLLVMRTEQVGWSSDNRVIIR